MTVPTTANVSLTNRPIEMPLLRGALRGDAIFILIASIGFIVGSAQLAMLTGLSATLLLAVGVVCLAYAAYLWWATNSQPLRMVGWINVALNYIWVAASILLLVAGWIPLTGFGFWLIVGLAVVVDTLASIQAYALVKRK